MERYNLLVRKLYLSEDMQKALAGRVTEDARVAAGQLRLAGDWFTLTYPHTVTVKGVSENGSEAPQEINTVRAVRFRPHKSWLLIRGGATEVKHIVALCEELALKLSSGRKEQQLNYAKYFRIEPCEVDLALILSKYEKQGVVADIRKLRVRDMEVRIGIVNRCIISTSDYDGARKELAGADSRVLGLEISLHDPERTFLYIGVDGQVKLASATVEGEDQFEELAVEAATML